MLRCIPIPPSISTEEPCSCLECNTHWINSINGGLCVDCCSPMRSHATVDLHRCAMYRLGRWKTLGHFPHVGWSFLARSMAGGSSVWHFHRSSPLRHIHFLSSRTPIVSDEEVCGYYCLRAASSVSRHHISTFYIHILTTQGSYRNSISTIFPLRGVFIVRSDNPRRGGSMCQYTNPIELRHCSSYYTLSPTFYVSSIDQLWSASSTEEVLAVTIWEWIFSQLYIEHIQIRADCERETAVGANNQVGCHWTSCFGCIGWSV